MMTKPEAAKVIGNQPKWAVTNMARALAMMPLLNTADEWRRLEAAVVWLGRGAPMTARNVLKAKGVS